VAQARPTKGCNCGDVLHSVLGLSLSELPTRQWTCVTVRRYSRRRKGA